MLIKNLRFVTTDKKQSMQKPYTGRLKMYKIEKLNL